MKKIKRLFTRAMSCFLAAILALSVCGWSVAAAVSPRAEQAEFEVCMYIVSYDAGEMVSSLDFTGHAFLLFENLGTVSVTIGHMPLPAGKSITVGTFGNREAHDGVWYNIEAYGGQGISQVNCALGYTLSEEQADIVSQTINANDYWSLSFNCAGFAKEVWNSVATGTYQVTGWTPALLCSSIQSKANHINYLYIPVKGESAIARQTPTSYVYDSSGKYGESSSLSAG